MPSYQDHLLFGSIIVLVFSYIAGPVLSYSLETVLVASVFILLASVFPDVDHSGSVVHRRAKAFTTVLAASAPLAFFYPEPMLMLLGSAAVASTTYSAFTWLKPRHRTITHTFQAAVVFSAAVGVVSAPLFGTFLPAVFAFLAYGSHLALDRVF
ncbi:MAG: metal-dependent hydrolase [Candidatus Nanohaloarchaea archaeon]